MDRKPWYQLDKQLYEYIYWIRNGSIKYDGLTTNLGNLFIDYKQSNKTIGVNKSNIEKRTKPKKKNTIG